VAGRPSEGTVSLVGASARVDAGANRPGYSWDHAGVALGMTRALSPAWTIGLNASATTGNAKVGGIETDATAFNADAVAGWAGGPFYAKLGAGAGLVSFSDVERGTVGPLLNRSQTSAITGSVAAEAGMTFGFGGVSLSPRARLAWIGANLDGFEERGVVAPVAVESRRVGTLSGAAELRAGVDLLRAGTRALSAFATIGYETYFAQSGDTLDLRLVNNTALPFAVALSDPRSPGLVVGAGLQGSLTEALALGVEYRGAFGEGGSRRHQAMGNVSYRF
ncbi:MAG TPA: autotransporter outer membrane beta-barrel domain-containing protein, partial [Salinarimonas sp.]|nr:autotransporter outer membrane beta-barrel domain-containing protein [Salinarimonas sp.]